MKNNNFKKIFPVITSIIVIVGMAVQSFATNVDMAAFVKKDKYMTKYYELDWRIKDIDTMLNKLYKFTCTNVRTLAGGGSWGWGSSVNTISQSGMFALNTDSSGVAPFAYLNYAELSQDKYLRFGQADCLTYTATLYNSSKLGKTLVYEVPASMLVWRDGVEFGENCKLRYKITANNRLQDSQTFELVMGPFKKLPVFSSVGSSKTAGWLCQVPICLMTTTFEFSNFSYAVNSETEPSTWTTHATRIYNNYTSRYNSTYSALPKQLDFDSPYDYNKTDMYTTFFHFNSNTPPNFSSYTNIWLKATMSVTPSPTTSYLASVNTLNAFLVTSWNNNK